MTSLSCYHLYSDSDQNAIINFLIDTDSTFVIATRLRGDCFAFPKKAIDLFNKECTKIDKIKEKFMKYNLNVQIKHEKIKVTVSR